MRNDLIFAVILVSLFIGCTSNPQCNKPYIWHGADCCLDVNNNSICDTDESTTTTTTTLIISNISEEMFLTEQEIQSMVGAELILEYMFVPRGKILGTRDGCEYLHSCVGFSGDNITLVSEPDASLIVRNNLQIFIGVYNTTETAKEEYLRWKDNGLFAGATYMKVGDDGVRTFGDLADARRLRCLFSRDNIVVFIWASPTGFISMGKKEPGLDFSALVKKYGKNIPLDEGQFKDLCKAQDQKIKEYKGVE